MRESLKKKVSNAWNSFSPVCTYRFLPTNNSCCVWEFSTNIVKPLPITTKLLPQSIIIRVLHIMGQNLLWNWNTAITTKISSTDFSWFLTPTVINHTEFHLRFLLQYLKFTLLSQTMPPIATYVYWLQLCWWFICKQKKDGWGGSYLLWDRVFHSAQPCDKKKLLSTCSPGSQGLTCAISGSLPDQYMWLSFLLVGTIGLIS